MRYLHTMLRVRDLDAALDFFCDKLGLVQVRRSDHEGGRFSLVFLSTGHDDDPAMVELTWNWDQEDEYDTGRYFGHLAYAVDDIYALCERLQAAGVTILRPPEGRPHGLREVAGRALGGALAGRRRPAAEGALGIDAVHRQLVVTPAARPPAGPVTRAPARRRG